MHSCGVVHRFVLSKKHSYDPYSSLFRDCNSNNLMMDPRPIFPKMYSPVHPLTNRAFTGTARFTRRTRHPVKYYIIDFGLSHKYQAGEPRSPLYPVLGGDKTVPEFGLPPLENFDNSTPRDPFPTDVFYIGNLLHEYFVCVSSCCWLADLDIDVDQIYRLIRVV